ncbi:MAG: fibronectin type III domain-containing protein, partial [Actinomycetes bacterium]
ADLSTGPYNAATVKVYRDGSSTPYDTVEAANGSTTTATYQGASGYSYSFAVSTKNSSGSSANSPVSNKIKPSTNALPGAVEDGLAETSHGIEYGNGQIRVSWTDPTNTAGTLRRVKVEYKTTTESWSAAHVYDAAYPGSRYLVINSSNLVPGTAYNVRISASLNASAPYTYGASVELAATVTPLTRPAPATNLVATPGDGSVSLTWTAGNTGGTPITNYQIDYRLASTSSWSSATTISTNSAVASATVTGLTNGSAYLLRVRAENAEGDDQTGIATATSVTPNPLPGGPVDLLGSAGNSSVTLGWTAPSAANLFGQTITDYKVEYRPSTSGTWVTFAHTASVTPSIAVTGLANGIAYYFRVSTKTGAGFSSATVTAATVTPTNSLGSPALDQVASTVAPGAVSILDNQTNLGALAVPTASTGVFRASAAGVLVSFKALDTLGYVLPLNVSNQLVVYAGQKVSVTATGLKAGSRARLFVSGTTASIGTKLADADGKVSFTAKLPAGLTKTAHV